MRNVAIILAAGQGRRMKTKEPKQYIELAGKPILAYSLAAFANCSFIDEIVLVVGKDQEDYVRESIIEKYGIEKVTHIITGGKERFNSVYAGLKILDPENKIHQVRSLDGEKAKRIDTSDLPDYIFIHDGVRPLISKEVIERAYDKVREVGACVVGVPAVATMKVVDAEGVIHETLDRSKIWTIQTPQVFSFALIKEAYDRCVELYERNITDDATTVERMMDHPVHIVEGSYDNIKITTPEDLLRGELYLTQLGSKR